MIKPISERIAIASALYGLSNPALVVYLDIVQDQVDEKTVKMAYLALMTGTFPHTDWLSVISGIPENAPAIVPKSATQQAQGLIDDWLYPAVMQE